jgi:hypothetical protein
VVSTDAGSSIVISVAADSDAEDLLVGDSMGAGLVTEEDLEGPAEGSEEECPAGSQEEGAFMVAAAFMVAPAADSTPVGADSTAVAVSTAAVGATAAGTGKRFIS